MYFDTIHEVPEFDAIVEPEEGYRSCWDTDTDIECCDDGFLFADLDGDSASVICLNDEEAMHLITRWKDRQEAHGRTTTEEEVRPHHIMPVHNQASIKVGPDSTYEHIDGDVNPEEHVYESIDDCVAEYQLFLSNASNGSADSHDSPTHTPTHGPAKVTANQVNVRKSSFRRTRRVNSLPMSHEPVYSPSRKLSDCTEYAQLRGRQGPASLYSTLHSSDGVHGSEYSTLLRFSEKPGTADSEKKCSSKPITIMLKHKGKSYVLPINETKKPKKRPSPKHSTGMMKASPSAATQLSNITGLVMPQSPSIHGLQHQALQMPRRQNSPPKSELKEHANSQKRKSKQHLSQPTNPKLLTLYGVI